MIKMINAQSYFNSMKEGQLTGREEFMNMENYLYKLLNNGKIMLHMSYETG